VGNAGDLSSAGGRYPSAVEQLKQEYQRKIKDLEQRLAALENHSSLTQAFNSFGTTIAPNSVD
jgi:hypothetical protein